MIAPVHRRPMSSIAPWNTAHTAGELGVSMTPKIGKGTFDRASYFLFYSFYCIVTPAARREFRRHVPTHVNGAFHERIHQHADLTVTDAARQRRSVRAYEPEPIAHEDLESIIDVVRLAPSAFNVQPWRFVMVESAETKAQLAAAAYNQRQVASAPAVIVLYTDMAESLATIDEVVHPNMEPEQRQKAKAGILASFAKRSDAEREAWARARATSRSATCCSPPRRTATRRRPWRLRPGGR
jgi:hypothetical protein